LREGQDVWAEAVDRAADASANKTAA
jgi:hypothetical protein